MNWFKSIWQKMRKSNGLPGNQVLIPMTPETPVAIEDKPKRKYTRKKKDANNS